MKAVLDNPKFTNSQTFFVLACSASRMHKAKAAVALDAYGDHGALISGCVRDHFPAEVKDALRFWSQEVTRLSDLAYANAPKYSRLATIRRLGQAVATRDGSGFYGPQPGKEPETRVIFRMDRGEVVAVFPDQVERNGDVGCYAHMGQHSSCSRDWYATTKAATEAEYAPLKRELESAPYRYNLRVMRRWSLAR